MEVRCRIALLLLGAIGGSVADIIYLVSPNVLRVNTDETIGIAFDGKHRTQGIVYVQDYPNKLTNISVTSLSVLPGQVKLFKIRIEPEKFPVNFLTSPLSQKLVSLNAQFPNFVKEILIPISIQSGYVFIQTDKPIYTPSHRVQIRIIPLNEEALPSENVFKLQIKNPDNVTVQEVIFDEMRRDFNNDFKNHVFIFPPYANLGMWSAVVNYGYDLQQNSAVYFELREYVLPTFTVDLKTPPVILPTHRTITIEVTAKYVYGEMVKGFASFRLGVKGPNGLIFFGVVTHKELQDGSYTLKINTDEVKNRTDIGWFPKIEASRLYVESTVVDVANGNRETATDMNGRFFTTPFNISFERCLKDFKPGLASVFEAHISYVYGAPAVGILTRITAIADGHSTLNIEKNTTRSDKNGKVSFQIHPEINHKIVYITLETIDPSYEGSQAKGTFEQHVFKSKNNYYLALSRSTGHILKPDRTFGIDVHYDPPGIRDIYYSVVARGKLLLMSKFPQGSYKMRRMELDITHEMVPSFRIVVFAEFEKQLLADSLRMEVEEVCHPNSEVTVDPEFSSIEPGGIGKIVIRGTKGTTVGLIAVDEAVLALSKRDLLTKTKVFKTLDSHDLGCGPGGGVTTDDTLSYAGIAIVTNSFSPSASHSCGKKRRRKREAAFNIVNTYTGLEKRCCQIGLEPDIHYRDCEERKVIAEIYLAEISLEEKDNCSKAFIECCEYAEEIDLHGDGPIDSKNLGSSSHDDILVIDSKLIDDLEKGLTLRRDFKETWIYEEKSIGADGREELFLTLPHSITTWVIQSVSVSPTHGICVAEPKKLVSSKKIFVHLNLPYSVVRNEQVDIQATVFNYGNKELRAFVSMYGVKDLCSGTQPGERSERKTIVVGGMSARSLTFPVVPLKAENFPIKVVVMTPDASDMIEKKLRVVPEGVSKDISVPVVLDPTNQQKRKRRDIQSILFTDIVDIAQQSQATVVNTPLPEGFVPGSASCSITAIGSTFGPAVETAIKNPQGLLKAPGGCGEQRLTKLAPTVYAMKYLKAVGKITADIEAKGYEWIRTGYSNLLSYRNGDGSFSIYPRIPSSTWITAFVLKVFCQASNIVHIDEDILCGGVRWLIQNQENDGSYIDKHPVNSRIVGGEIGKSSVTAFVLITLEECECYTEEVSPVKRKALTYLEDHLGELTSPLEVAIVAYALALSNSQFMDAANNRLLELAVYDEDTNQMHWTSKYSVEAVQTAGYALLTQIMFDDMEKSKSIVNWLNTQVSKSGAYKSTQDTVVALQSMSEYAIKAKRPPINLVTHITSSNDKNFHKVLTFTEENALVLQDVQVDKIGGSILISTTGNGTGFLSVNLRYNVFETTEETCKFDVKVNMTEAKRDNAIMGLLSRLGSPDGQSKPSENMKLKYNISLCVRYLGNQDSEMSIMEVEVFSGFDPVVADLQKFQDDPNHLIDRFERSNRGVVFYLQRIPAAEYFCFSFHVIREFIVGDTKMSSITTYEYYKPEKKCTNFYSPERNTPMIRTTCIGSVCTCAEGGCPAKDPFAEISKLRNKTTRREEYKTLFCEKYDYVWIGQVMSQVTHGGYLNISFEIKDVIKEGAEKTEEIVDESRTLLARDNCRTAKLVEGGDYLILGRDSEPYENENKQKWYRYFLDKASLIHRWGSGSRRFKSDLQFVTDDLKENGCDQ